MSITNELRKWADDNTVRGEVLTTLPAQRSVRGTVESLLLIADRIDAEHECEIRRAAQLLDNAEKDRDFNYANWQDCKQKVLQHNITIDELDAEIERLKDELAHRIELPVDADGETIHIGDRLIDKDDKPSKPAFVKCILYNDEGCAVSDIDPLGCWYEPSLLRHHRPTVEDVLRELIKRWGDMPWDSDSDDDEPLIAEYAAKLQLRGDVK